MDGGVQVRNGFGGGGREGEGVPVGEDEVPAAGEILPGESARWKGRYSRAFHKLVVGAGLDRMTGRVGRGGRWGISISTVLAAEARRCGICGRWAGEEGCDGQKGCCKQSFLGSFHVHMRHLAFFERAFVAFATFICSRARSPSVAQEQR